MAGVVVPVQITKPDATETDGSAFTVTVTDEVLLQPAPFVPVTV
jgi:hypothetical protein